MENNKSAAARPSWERQNKMDGSGNRTHPSQAGNRSFIMDFFISCSTANSTNRYGQCLSVSVRASSPRRRIRLKPGVPPIAAGALQLTVKALEVALRQPDHRSPVRGQQGAMPTVAATHCQVVFSLGRRQLNEQWFRGCFSRLFKRACLKAIGAHFERMPLPAEIIDREERQPFCDRLLVQRKSAL